MAKVQLSAEARENFRDLDGSAQRVVARALKRLELDPHLRGQPLGSRVRELATSLEQVWDR